MPGIEMVALADFLRGDADSRAFHHRDHVARAYELLTLVPFADAVSLYARGLKTMAARAGHPGAYHETITIGFLSLVAERMAEQEHEGFQSFAHANSDLMDRRILANRYGAGELETPLARRVFVLPRPQA